MFYILFAWIASICYGFVAIIGKLASKYAIRNNWLLNYLWGFLSLLLLIPFALSNHAEFPSNWTNIIYGSLFSSIFSILYIIALSKLDVTVFSPLFNFRTVFSAILAVLILNEKLSPFQIGLIITIFIAGLFVSLDESFTFKSFFKKSVLTAITAMLFLAFTSIFTNISISQNGYWSTTLWMAIFSQLFLTLTIPLFLKDIKKINVRQFLSVLNMSLALLVGNLAANKAYAYNVSISSAIISLPFSMFMAFIFSIFAPRLLEKHTLKVYFIRFIAAGVMIFAALKLSF